MAHPPPAEVLSEFHIETAQLRPLPGGRGLTWRAGEAVLRPSCGDAETDWKAYVLAELEHTNEFRTARPIRGASGNWSVGGWEAWQWLPGAADESRASDVLRAGRAFHRSISHLPRPAFLDEADDPWAQSDRIAWEEEPIPAGSSVLERLGSAFRAVEGTSQMIHGDLLGNVMFARGHPAAIIDWAPYWRPPGFADAIVTADAVCWHGMPLAGMRALVADIPEGSQLLIRALVFRIATLHLRGAWNADMARRHARVVEAVVE